MRKASSRGVGRGWAGRRDLSTGSEYLYGCPPAAPVGRLGRMTTHRAPKPVAGPTQTVERAVTLGLILAVLAGLGWIAGMIYTIAEWPL